MSIREIIDKGRAFGFFNIEQFISTPQETAAPRAAITKAPMRFYIKKRK